MRISRLSERTRGSGCVDKVAQPAAHDPPLLLSGHTLPFEPNSLFMAERGKKRNRLDSGPVPTPQHKKVKLPRDYDNDPGPSEPLVQSTGPDNSEVRFSSPIGLHSTGYLGVVPSAGPPAGTDCHTIKQLRNTMLIHIYRII